MVVSSPTSGAPREASPPPGDEKDPPPALRSSLGGGGFAPNGGSTPKGSVARPSKASCNVLAADSIFISACALDAISYSSSAARSRSTARIAAPASSKNLRKLTTVSRAASNKT